MKAITVKSKEAKPATKKKKANTPPAVRVKVVRHSKNDLAEIEKLRAYLEREINDKIDARNLQAEQLASKPKATDKFARIVAGYDVKS